MDKQLEFLKEFKSLLEKYEAYISRDYHTDFAEIYFDNSNETIFIGSSAIYVIDLDYAIKRLEADQ